VELLALDIANIKKPFPTRISWLYCWRIRAN
jgi:hypothetical protein